MYNIFKTCNSQRLNILCAKIIQRIGFTVDTNDCIRKLYAAESPEKLAVLLERKKETLSNIMPSLVQDYLRCSPAINTIKTYQGLSGIKLLSELTKNSLQQMALLVH